jgi:hypothetical protein
LFERTEKYALFDFNRNEGILVGLKVEPVDVKLRGYKLHWLRNATRMNNRLLNEMINYRPNGRRHLGKAFKRLFRRGRISFIKD